MCISTSLTIFGLTVMNRQQYFHRPCELCFVHYAAVMTRFYKYLVSIIQLHQCLAEQRSCPEILKKLGMSTYSTFYTTFKCCVLVTLLLLGVPRNTCWLKNCPQILFRNRVRAKFKYEYCHYLQCASVHLL